MVRSDSPKGTTIVIWFHPQEAQQVGALLRYESSHPGARYLVAFEDGESYLCSIYTAYESENGGELDIEMDDPRYDEFHQIAMTILEPIRAGNRNYRNVFTLDYREWPVLIKDVDSGTVVFPVNQETGH